MHRSEFKTTDDKIKAEQIRLMYNHFTYMSLANVPSMIIFGYTISDGIDSRIFYTWFCLLFITVTLRLRLTAAFRRTNRNSSRRPAPQTGQSGTTQNGGKSFAGKKRLSVLQIFLRYFSNDINRSKL